MVAGELSNTGLHLRGLVDDGQVKAQRPQFAHERPGQSGAHDGRLIEDLVHRALLPLPLLLLQRAELPSQRPPLCIVLRCIRCSVYRTRPNASRIRIQSRTIFELIP